jgi:hypothetical protein
VPDYDLRSGGLMVGLLPRRWNLKGVPPMKRNKGAKLQLNRETIKSLDLATASGGAVIVVPTSVLGNCTMVLSICYSCTTPLDTCPPQPTTPAYTCA